MILVGDWAPGEKDVDISLGNNFVLANLEGPILPAGHNCVPAKKAGPSLFSISLPVQSTRFAFSLANNHIMDYGFIGLKKTLDSLNQKGFMRCGAGNNVASARLATKVDDKGILIGILSCCEAQFGVARHSQPGVAEFGPWVYRAIHELREKTDAVVVSVHAAVEDFPWPSPYIRELYRSFIDAGASIVHGHHSHVPQGYESYEDGVIFYGLGNFAVDPELWRDYPNGLWSLAVDIDFRSKPPNWQLQMFNIRHQKGSKYFAVEDSTDQEMQTHKAYFNLCNYPLDDPCLFAGLWQEIALNAFYSYGSRYMMFPPTLRAHDLFKARTYLRIFNELFKKKKLHPGTLSQNDYMLWHHIFSCESHRQMMASALGILCGEIEDVRTEKTQELFNKMVVLSKQVAK